MIESSSTRRHTVNQSAPAGSLAAIGSDLELIRDKIEATGAFISIRDKVEATGTDVLGAIQPTLATLGVSDE